MESLYLPWLNNIKTLLHGAITVAEFVASGESVMIQEGVDCDSVVQISCLAQILLDPYYRTIEGKPTISTNSEISRIFHLN